MLPSGWVDRIFMRLQGVYGREFTSQFSLIDQSTGLDIGLENAKLVWAEELATFSDWPEAIAYALKQLPERSPNVIRFRELCRQAPPKQSAAMLTHEISEEQIQANKQKVKELLASLDKPTVATKVEDDGIEWARRITRNPIGPMGKPRSQAAINLARRALAERGEKA